MGSGNRSGVMGGGGTEKSESESISSEYNNNYCCDVGLGLKVQRTESYPNPKRTMVIPHHLPQSQSQPHHHHHFPPSAESQNTMMSNSTSVVGLGFASGSDSAGVDSGPIYCNTSNNSRFACVTSDIYDVVSDSSLTLSAGAAALVLPRTFHPFTSDFPFKSPSGGSMPAPVEVPFTASQWEELERQTMIYKYMMASVPVPAQLLLPIARTTTPASSNIVPATSQSNMSGLDMRFSSGSDPEPWRCRRTDGKKWRCSRDVAPDQKYCERHAHKSRPRSRKLVESQPHNTTTSSTTTTTNLKARPLINLQANATPTTQPFQKPTFNHFPTLLPAASTYDQPRCPEWFTKRDNSRVSISMNQQWQQLMQSSSRVGSKRDNTECNKEMSFYQLCYGEGKEPMNQNSYIGDGQTLQNQQLNDQLVSFQASTLGGETTHTTRHFIDAWSSADREEINEISNKRSDTSRGKPPLSSLTLSMPGGNGIDEESEYAQMGLGMMMDSERETGGGFKSQWLNNPVSWMNSPPGGPLGEALCLGIASTAKAGSNLPSPRGYSNSTTTGTSSKSSCEESGHGLHFMK
ncbi:growth-regulating factor 8 [Cornus florida]|uniref:growth-regulating factor 8 n=1 Tax=Cornus florida TaxID=4283 RepID=UPI0028972C6B|nr:growth-regulating factor 8 [Cornus florida]